MLIQNPLFQVDMPDPDVIRLGDAWYMVSTTMFYMPGAPILKSKDLCHWEIVSYVFETIEDNEIYRLENGKNAYGSGQWATSLTTFQGKVYASFVCNDMQKTYIYSTDDIEKTGWKKHVIDGILHDMSFLFYQGVPYLVYGNGDIYLAELTADLTGLKEGGVHQLLFETEREGIMLRCEGCRAYVRDGKIYLIFIDWPKGGRRRVICYRTDDLFGSWEHRVILDDDKERPGRGIAQGPLVLDETGNGYAILFQDRGASGRIPFMMPAGFEDGWPYVGVKENGTWKVPSSVELPYKEYTAAPLVISDSLDHAENRLGRQWQWNHNPDKENWSFTERSGFLRLTAGRVSQGLMDARNTLTQRTTEPGCSCYVTLDPSGMKEGDFAGLTAFQGRYGQIGVTVEDGKKYLLSVLVREDGTKAETRILLKEELTRLRIDFDYRDQKDLATFYYMNSDGDYVKLGEELKMIFTLDLFVGYRIGLFQYGTKEAGGYADFCDFVIEPW